MIVAGAGTKMSGAYDALNKLADSMKIPVATSLAARTLYSRIVNYQLGWLAHIREEAQIKLSQALIL